MLARCTASKIGLLVQLSLAAVGISREQRYLELPAQLLDALQHTRQ